MIASLLTLLAAITASVGNIKQRCNFTGTRKYPSWIFYIAWIILFILLAIFGEILFRNKLYTLFVVYVLLLFTLAIYPWVQWHLCYNKGAYIILLLSAILTLILLVFTLLNTLAGVLIIPLLVWLLFALYISMDTFY